MPGSRQEFIRYNSHQTKLSGLSCRDCVKTAWLEVFAHENPACALVMYLPTAIFDTFIAG
jgi:hypothetical protein